MGLRLNDRDREIMREVARWRFLLSRQIKVLGGFSGQRACDRRLKALYEAGYIDKKHIIYGIPRLYFVTKEAVKIFGLDYYTPNIRIEQIEHDIAVADTAIYLIKNDGIDQKSITTERDLRNRAGFGNQKHFPDFIYTKDGKPHCVEVEISTKRTDVLNKNIIDNYNAYDVQKWIVPSDKAKIIESVKSAGKRYGVIDLILLDEVKEYVKGI